MTKELNVLIGAGFSFKAGLPLGNDIRASFDRPLRNELLKMSSSEWLWAERQDHATQHNGRLNYDHLEYSFIMEEIVKTYKAASNDEFIDYEDFYQYVKDNTVVEGWYEGIIQTAEERFYAETNSKRDSGYGGFSFRHPERYRPQEIINHLISDMLWSNKTDDQLVQEYYPFVQFLKKYESVTIFTLNHDMILERLFRLLDIPYCDGFSTEGSELKYGDKFLHSFQNDFSSARIKLVKLHGSIDMYLFEHGTEQGVTMTRDGHYTYFKPKGYHEKHHVQRVDLKTGETVQHMNFDVIPKFITGKNKLAFIQSDYMYSKLHQMYQQNIQSGNDLLVIGYSYRDEHMNAELKNFDVAGTQNIVNVNPGTQFPFDAPSMRQISDLSELPI